MSLRFSPLVFVALAACNTGPKDPPAQPEPKPVEPAPRAAEGVLRLGAPIEASAEKIALSEIAKSPSAFVGKKFATTGTVTAVCQHMGCWMEIKDDAGEAHIKMAQHAFFVPKTASGRKAKVLATLVKAEDEPACDNADHDKMAAAGGAAPGAKGKGCRAEAEAQLGRPLAKLELVAEGVELL
ncbi:MAG: DUF4920 domain-containing protein [Labilithrix sp.]|nr:DUF4920 domain-containing protein [Labilithrix sp.]